MSRARLPRLLVAAVACLGIAGCATVQTEGRARMIDMPLASTHADIAFTMTTGSRHSAGCDGSVNCPAAADTEAAARFAVQVRRVAGSLQTGARHLYPDLAQRVPGLVDSRFDVYVVDGDELGSVSSANGRIALNAAFGVRLPYDDWMAFVIAREMGHVIARHHEENSAAGIATSVIMNILIPGSSLLKTLMSAGGSEIAAQSKRDVQGMEADAIAYQQFARHRRRTAPCSLMGIFAAGVARSAPCFKSRRWWHGDQTLGTSHEGRGRDPKTIAEGSDLANVEIPVARKDFGNHALAANLAQIGLLETMLLHQKLQRLNPADVR